MTHVAQNLPQNPIRFAHLLAHLANSARAKLRDRIELDATKASLAKLSDARLRDIGLIRHDLSTFSKGGRRTLSGSAVSRVGIW